MLCPSPNRLNSESPGKEAAVCLDLILIMDSTSGAWMEVSQKVSVHPLELRRAQVLDLGWPLGIWSCGRKRAKGPALQHASVGNHSLGLAEMGRTQQGPDLRCQENSKGLSRSGPLFPGQRVSALCTVCALSTEWAQDQPSDRAQEVEAMQTQVHEGCSGTLWSPWES